MNALPLLTDVLQPGHRVEPIARAPEPVPEPAWSADLGPREPALAPLREPLAVAAATLPVRAELSPEQIDALAARVAAALQPQLQAWLRDALQADPELGAER